MNKIIAPRSSLWAIALTVTTCVAAIAISTGAAAEDADQSADQTIVAQATTTPPAPAAAPAATPPAPDFGSNLFERFFKYEAWEIGKSGPPADPNAPSSRKAGWPDAPESTPPMPFTEWPYGGTTTLGDNRPASVDSPLMVAIAPTGLGKWLSDAHIQAYGWVDVGGNISTNHVSGGNSPAAYDYNPNTAQLDQAVLYVERTPDTVQTDHVDWGFRISAIYGENYRYTTSYGVASYQLLKYNKNYGYDFPMVYGELYVPQIMDGLLIRIGRFISLPDIEAQLAPNYYMYTHSLTYTNDNYTNTGIQTTLAVNKNVFLQFGLSVGSDTALSNAGAKLVNLLPGNPLYPGATFLKDPGAKLSYTGCARFQSNTGKDNIYFCADAFNNGVYGYNNLQWLGLTYYHKFNDKWHISWEGYYIHENNVPNLNDATVYGQYGTVAQIIANGGTPFSPNNIPFNAPNAAQCKSTTTLTCSSPVYSTVFYLNYSPNFLNNFSLRGEIMDDQVGQRTGTPNRYFESGIGWQHWLSPQIELRPEVTYYHAFDHAAFNGNSNLGIAPDKKDALVASGDIIMHF